MLPPGWELILRGAMEDAGLHALPPAERTRVATTVAGRLEQHGIASDAHNWGGVLCGRTTHEGCCCHVEGRRLRRFASPSEGARRLVELSALYTGSVPVGGFRSVLRTEGFFGPNEASEKTFQDLSAAWAGLEAEFGAVRLRSGFTKDSYQAWLAFRDKWKAGDEDTTALPAMVADVNVTRQNLGRARVDIAVRDVTQSTSALALSARTDSAARTASAVVADAWKGAASSAGGAWKAAPLPVKLGAAAVALLSVVVAILRVTR